MEELNKRPLYLQVADLLARKIASDELAAGQALPNEYDLSSQLNVSIGTLRKAVDTLVQHGLVNRRQGKGTFVVDRRAIEIRNVFERLRNADGSHISWVWEEISVETTPSTPDEQKMLRLASGDTVTRMRRLGLNGSRRVCYVTAVLPFSLYGDISDVPSQDKTILGLAHARKILLHAAEDFLDLRGASANAAVALGLAEGHPLIRLRRLSIDHRERPVEWRVLECHFAGEYYSCPAYVSGAGTARHRAVSI